MRARTYASNLIRIASAIEADSPFLSYELSRSTRRMVGDSVRVSVVNPGIQTFENHVEKMVLVLKSLSQELESALSDLDDAKEFAKFFSGHLAEEKELRELLNNAKKLGKVAASHDVAGFKDWFKGITDVFRKENEGDEDAGMQPSYQLDESTIDDFVEGSSEWADASYYIEQEFRENKDFFDGANQVLQDMAEIRKAPSTDAVQALLENVKRFTRFGENLLRGLRKHLLEPAPKVTLEDDEDKGQGSGSKSDPLWNLESTVEHYVDILRENLGDEGKTLSLLKELFGKVKPALGEERADVSLASRQAAQKRVLPALVRLAYSRPRTRTVLLPIIRQAVGR